MGEHHPPAGPDHVSQRGRDLARRVELLGNGGGVPAREKRVAADGDQRRVTSHDGILGRTSERVTGSACRKEAQIIDT